ncbi:predicted protein [Naegleria gruberi]|uniref:Predicted protein n=1 Tax=Naegleria gruberi TaxID=5762 RepID=D2VAH9_NAEGR|nr:uncharacterized protein NAEGRDRAFT_65864 [Naegleria gruberi]EFC46077.1 predicted protein [Naegleria gruberi]|eukprot:XP_002678821.1 predicted protein [Naegleria gruberi strain NEG-M]
MEEPSATTTLTLIDLHPISPNLFTKLKEKFKSPPLVEFSQNFRRIDAISNGSFNMAICREFNYLVTGSHDSLEIYDLITHQPVQESIHFGEGVYGIDFERENSGQLNLILSTRRNHVVKYDFKRILREKSFGEPIFQVPIRFDHV